MNAKELDQFYTHPDVAKNCLAELVSLLDDSSISGYHNGIQWIEPSAGNGSFFNLLPKKRRIGFDLDPKIDELIKGDFLLQPISNSNLMAYKKRVVIGNPPFGKRAALAIDFFNRCTEWAPTVAFIVPVQFRKFSVQSNLNPEFKLVADLDLPDNAFLLNGKSYHVNCCFQIWTRKKTTLPNLRILAKPVISHSDFEMWQYNNTVQAERVFQEEFDFAVLRQGYGDYTKLVNHEQNCNRRKQWILFKAKNGQVLRRLKKIDFAKLAQKNTSVPGFGKADVVAEYNSIYGE